MGLYIYIYIYIYQRLLHNQDLQGWIPDSASEGHCIFGDVTLIFDTFLIKLLLKSNVIDIIIKKLIPIHVEKA